GDYDFVGVPTQATGGVRHPRVLWNQGNVTFVPVDEPLDLAVATNSSQANVLDVNGDGRLDFITGPRNQTYNVLAVYLRKGDNSGFESPICQVLSGVPLADTFARGIPADVDGDGDADFVSYNRCFENLHFDG